MKVSQLKDLSQKEYNRIIKRSLGINPDIMPRVRTVMYAVRRYGDTVLIEDFKRRFGTSRYQSLIVSKQEIKEAYKQVDMEFISALRQMIKNITAVHR
ncbi:MAG: histidinol dehydrogenase, partial [Candidatus Roizmanbacteria bacterium]|nr:histidinol dehydrogenase [Candidatus Roizmanbacteria bacterium]